MSHLDLSLILKKLKHAPEADPTSLVIFSGYDMDFIITFILKPILEAVGEANYQRETRETGRIYNRPYLCIPNEGDDDEVRKRGRSLTAGLVFYHDQPDKTNWLALDALQMTVVHLPEDAMIELHF